MASHAPPFGGPMEVSISVLGQSYHFPELTGGTWTFHVRAVDAFGYTGPWSDVVTSVDATPPTKPILDPVPEYTNGTRITLSWSPSTDDYGVAGYRVDYWPGSVVELKRTAETESTTITIFGLEDGFSYYYLVTAVDVVGNPSEGAEARSTQDNSPPFQAYFTIPPYIYRTTLGVTWSHVTDLGVGRKGGVEYNVWCSSYDVIQPSGIYDYRESGWLTGLEYAIEDLEETTYRVGIMTRDAFGHISLSWERRVVVDLTPPVVRQMSPLDGDRLSGTVVVDANVDDASPLGYSLACTRPGGGGSLTIATGTLPEGGGSLAVPWDTRDVNDGRCTLVLQVTDAAGWASVEEITLEVMNALVVLSPLDFRLSDPTPEEGEEVTVSIPVRNTGRAPAINVTVAIYIDGELVRTVEGLDIHFYQEAVVTHRFTARDGQVLTARVRGFYESAEMADGFEVRTGEGGLSSGSTATWVGVIAILLAVVAIALHLVDRRKGVVADQGEWEETRD